MQVSQTRTPVRITGARALGGLHSDGQIVSSMYEFDPIIDVLFWPHFASKEIYQSHHVSGVCCLLLKKFFAQEIL